MKKDIPPKQNTSKDNSRGSVNIVYKQSITRAKTTGIKLIHILGKSAASILPGGGIAFDMLDTLVNHIMQYRNDLIKNRLNEFITHLIGGNVSEEEREKALNGDLSPEDMHLIITNVIQDEESRKTEYYAKLYKYYVLDDEFIKTKRYIAKAFKAFTLEDIEIIEKLYKRYNYIIHETSSTKRDWVEKRIMSYIYKIQREPIKSSCINRLITCGILNPAKGNLPAWPNDMLLKVGYILEKY